jgi:hypothetical protein
MLGRSALAGPSWRGIARVRAARGYVAYFGTSLKIGDRHQIALVKSAEILVFRRAIWSQSPIFARALPFRDRN